MRHQVSEPPIILQGFLFFHVLTHFFHLFKHSFEVRPLGSSSLAIFVCMRWRTFVLLPMPVSHVVLLPAAWAVSPISRSFGTNWFWQFLAYFNHSQLLITRIIQPAHKNAVHHYDILPTSATCSACFVTS